MIDHQKTKTTSPFKKSTKTNMSISHSQKSIHYIIVLSILTNQPKLCDPSIPMVASAAFAAWGRSRCFDVLDGILPPKPAGFQWQIKVYKVFGRIKQWKCMVILVLGFPINSALFGGRNMGVEPKNIFFLPPKSSHFFIGVWFSIMNKPSILGGKIHLFLETPISL